MTTYNNLCSINCIFFHGKWQWTKWQSVYTEQKKEKNISKVYSLVYKLSKSMPKFTCHRGEGGVHIWHYMLSCKENLKTLLHSPSLYNSNRVSIAFASINRELQFSFVEDHTDHICLVKEVLICRWLTFPQTIHVTVRKNTACKIRSGLHLLDVAALQLCTLCWLELCFTKWRNEHVLFSHVCTISENDITFDMLVYVVLV